MDRNFGLWSQNTALPLLIVLLVAGCTDDAPTESDEQGPEVRILFPPEQIESSWYNDDAATGYVDVYVGAHDNESVNEVRLLHSRPRDARRHLIGASSDPIPNSSVPQEMRDQILLPRDWSLYRIRWNTSMTCWYETLFATAVDAASNTGVAREVTVLTIDPGCFKQSTPHIDFRVIPQEGPVDTEFVFDAVGDDPENPLTIWAGIPLNKIWTRWDLDGDGTWEVDWADHADATDRQTYRFAAAGNYRAKLQARIPQLDDYSEIKERFVVVTP